jgi:hypothetical protein
MSASKPLRYAVAGIAAVALAFGAFAIGSSNSGSGNGVANASRPFAPGQMPGNDQLPPGGASRNGLRPPGFGTPVTGATANKVAAAALARYKGTVERVVKLPDGSYVAHVMSSSGEYHVAVSKDFKVTGARQGGPGAGGPPGAPPSGAAPQSGPSSSSGNTTN